MLATYFSIIFNYVISVFSQYKYTFYNQTTIINAFRTNSRNISEFPIHYVARYGYVWRPGL